MSASRKPNANITPGGCMPYGEPMRAGTALGLAPSLGIALSCSRPRVSDDNPYSECVFKTADYDPDCPQSFQELQYARNDIHGFFGGCNTTTGAEDWAATPPDTVHDGLLEQVRRQGRTLEASHARNRHRCRRKATTAGIPPAAGVDHTLNTRLSPAA